MALHTLSRSVSTYSAKQHLAFRIGAPTLNKIISVTSQMFRGDSRTEWGGKGHVSGIVKIAGTPVSRLVRLTEAKSGVLIDAKWSGADGTYSFTRLRTDLLYTVSAHDFENGYNDVIAARARPVL